MNDEQLSQFSRGEAPPSNSEKPNLDIRRSLTLQVLIVLTLGLTISACTPRSSEVASSPSDTASPASGSTSVSSGSIVSVGGAGATYPAPLYQRWFAEYNKVNPETQVSYQSVGSGAGVEQFLAGSVDFGASDAPLKAEERAKFKTKFGGEPVQVPMTGGMVVFAYNLDGVKDLKLARVAYCGIATGKITKWNDPAIVKTNAGAKLPNEAIKFFHRSDSSGTTFQFTNHLKAACPEWTAGASKSVAWSKGMTGAQGNQGVAEQIAAISNSMGYVEHASAKQANLSMAAIENKSGKLIAPSPAAGAEAFVGEKVPDDLGLTVPDSTNPKAYPIAGLTWLLLYPQPKDATKTTALKAVIEWALTTGKALATELGYLPLGDELTVKAKAELNKVK
ncbi:phosphate ABC transporter substrate-binding protein PstS [Chamaesiphon sp. VAR_48_metabat_403]|uniref:phosphate ABC transporter substrate-binding protein PstS n=1 Tax=Chamaesiphon sp. VAR_48_metabat_403 TaxID=2964700 RepID=UPI00286D6CB5|nr:phosphate ABC transporter substrate-binding protein PstS [Chamaesiphon sp. VAR_48_metabat_403]